MQRSRISCRPMCGTTQRCSVTTTAPPADSNSWPPDKESQYEQYRPEQLDSESRKSREAKGQYMSTIHMHQTTNLTPGQYVAGLTDFGPGRSKVFGNSADAYLKVHQRGRTEADVTEGSSGIWERLHYDWSDPNHVVLATTDSNLWGGASGHTYTFTRRP